MPPAIAFRAGALSFDEVGGRGLLHGINPQALRKATERLLRKSAKARDRALVTLAQDEGE
jgi:hypothetical protein